MSIASSNLTHGLHSAVALEQDKVLVLDNGLVTHQLLFFITKNSMPFHGVSKDFEYIYPL